MTSPILLVSHFHWDREWYRPYEAFRGHLVDAIDAVLDQVEIDPGFCFVLDGQAIVLEDYLEVRPRQRDRLVAGLAGGRLAAGPWYVQPDSLLPGGETHVRNLLRGRAVAGALGPVSGVAYVPDSFGHPAQFPQLFAGFGLDPFLYWRGNGNELDALGPNYRWVAPDGTAVRAWHLGEGYFSAGGLDADDDLDATVTRLKVIVERLAALGGPVLLMNGFDHLPADTTTADVANAIGAQRALLDDVGQYLPDELREFTGALIGGRVTNLLPGVWSARMPLKLRNRRCETLLTAWAEPWAAFGAALGLNDERPSLHQAWRALLCNQAHDSIGGCSVDPVHERMFARYDDAEGHAIATAQRVLERLAGRSLTRPAPWTEAQTLAVFNASPRSCTDVVRIPLDPFPPWRASVTRFDIHPLMMPSFAGVTVDGEPARLVPSDDPNRPRFMSGVGGLDVEFVARAVPAFGYRRYKLAAAPAQPDELDDGTEIGSENVAVQVESGGTLAVTLGDRTYAGLFGIEDCVDRGDSYDADCDLPRVITATEHVARTRHASGIERLSVQRELQGIGTLDVTATVAPGVPFVRCDVRLDNRAPDHRLRLRFPTRAESGMVEAGSARTTFDTKEVTVTRPDDSGWVHAAPRTFIHQGWIEVDGLVVGAPGLPEAELTEEALFVTLVRGVGMLARIRLRTRPVPAAPEMPAPGAQCIGPITATIVIATNSRDATAAEIGLWGVLGDTDSVLASDASLLELHAERSVLSACKPAEQSDGLVVRVLNPSGDAETVTLRFGLDITDATPVRLDETPIDGPIEHDGRVVHLPVPAHALRSVLVQTLRR